MNRVRGSTKIQSQNTLSSVYTVRMLTPSTPLTLADLQQAGPHDLLSASNNGYLFTTAGREHVVRAEGLARLDARLPVVVHYLTANYTKYDTGARQALAATLRYWAATAPIMVLADVVVDSVQEIAIDTDAMDDTLFKLWYTGSVLVTREGVPFVANSSRRWKADCSTAWCEQHFPGSVARIQSAMALDMTSEEVAQFGFYSETAAVEVLQSTTLPVSLTEILP